MFGFSRFGSSVICWSCKIPIGDEAVGKDEFGSANDAFELLVRDVLELQPTMVMLSSLNALLVGTALGHSSLW